MKKICRLISVLLSIAICLALVGCGNETQTASTPQVDADFFTDEEVTLDNNDATANESTTSNNSTANNSTTNNKPSNNKTSTPTVSSNTSSTNTGSKKPVGSGKKWKDVLASMPKNLQGTTITVYNWNPVSEYTGATSAIEEFEKQTNITVKWKTEEYSTYLSKLASMVAANTAPDLVRLRTPEPIGLISIQPVSVTGYDFTDAAWDQNLMKDYTIGGGVYGVSLANTHIGSVSMMMYNKSLISKYDFEDPYQLWKNGEWTFSKFIKMCEEFKKVTNSEFACGGLGGWDAFIQPYGIQGPVGFDGKKYYNNTGNANFVKVSQQIADYYNTSHLFAINKSDEFNNGECLFWTGASVYARRNNSYHGSLKSAGTLYVVPMPAIDGQSKYYQARDEYEAYGIAKGAKNAAAAPYFLRYFLDPANYDLSAFFCTPQALDVYNWCMEQENTIWTTYYDNNWRYHGDTADAFAKNYLTTTGAQIASFLKSNSAVIDNRVKRFNDALNQMK